MVVMGQEGSSSVMGMGRPNLGPTCIQIVACGPDGICAGPGDTDDRVVGTGGTNSAGKFTIQLTAPLTCGEKLFAEDVCAMPALMGPIFTVICAPVAPTMSPPMVIALVAMLVLAGWLRLARTPTK